MRGLPEGRLKPVRAADHQRHIVGIKLPGPQLVCQRHCAERGAALVKRHHAAALGQRSFDALPLCSQQGGQAARAARLGFDGFEFDLELGWKAFGIVSPGALRPVGQTLADRNNQQPHGPALRRWTQQLFWPPAF